MGLYDYVNHPPIKCPVCGGGLCGTPVTSWQTKDGEPYLHTVEPETVDHFASVCGVCNAHIEAWRPRPDPPPPLKWQVTVGAATREFTPEVVDDE